MTLKDMKKHHSQYHIVESISCKNENDEDLLH